MSRACATGALSRTARATALAAILLLVAPTLTEAQEAQPTLAQLRDRRRVLIGQIAEATDRIARAEGSAAAAAGRLASQAGVIEHARHAVARHAVAAYVDASDDDPVVGLRRVSWADTLSLIDRSQLDRLRSEEDELLATRELAQEIALEIRAWRGTLEALRAELEQTITKREEADAEAARARAAATAVASGESRAVRATRVQGELMARYTFGPVADLPAGLVRSGTVIDGKASWYGPGFDGRQTASGAIFDQEGWTVAHRTLPLGTMLLVSRGSQQVLVLVNDRGPFVDGRVLDLSKGVARVLDTIHAGVATVRAEVVVPG